MGITSELRDDGIRVVTMAYPPVNALPVQGWFDVAKALDDAGRDPKTKVVVLRADGKGFNAGVDIKEMQNTDGFDALIGANKGCFAAFKAVYECAVPVIAAVNGFCVGGGVGLVGNADIVVASDDAYFGVPEVKQGALGAATHMARLVPQQMMRALYFTAQTIPATELHRFGSVYRVVPREQLLEAALEVAADIADKDGRVIRAAKEALNGIEPVDVNKSYRFEQGFTMELNLMGVSDELRDDFAGTNKGSRVSIHPASPGTRPPTGTAHSPAERSPASPGTRPPTGTAHSTAERSPASPGTRPPTGTAPSTTEGTK